jgi:hypothetical protein
MEFSVRSSLSIEAILSVDSIRYFIYKPLPGKLFDHQRCRIISDFPQLADVPHVSRQQYLLKEEV